MVIPGTGQELTTWQAGNNVKIATDMDISQVFNLNIKKLQANWHLVDAQEVFTVVTVI